MENGKLRSSGAMVAPHRARCNEARRAKLHSAKVWGYRLTCSHGHRRCPIVSFGHCPTIIHGIDPFQITFTSTIIRIIGRVRYYRTSSMPVAGGIHLPTHLRGDAISPCGLHCIAARCGATIASLLRSLLFALRHGCVFSHLLFAFARFCLFAFAICPPARLCLFAFAICPPARLCLFAFAICLPARLCLFAFAICLPARLWLFTFAFCLPAWLCLFTFAFCPPAWLWFFAICLLLSGRVILWFNRAVCSGNLAGGRKNRYFCRY